MTDFSFNKLVELNILPATLFIVVVATMCLGIYFKMVNFVKDKYITFIFRNYDYGNRKRNLCHSFFTRNNCLDGINYYV